MESSLYFHKGLLLLTMIILTIQQGDTNNSPHTATYIFSKENEICSYNETAPYINTTEADLEHDCFLTTGSVTSLKLEMIWSRNVLLVVSNDHIFEVIMNQNHTSRTLTYSAGSILDMTVDWVAGNIYYLDSDQEEIRALSLDGSYVTTLPIRNLLNTIGIAVDPAGKKLYWAVSNTIIDSGIWSSRLDGTQPVKFFQKYSHVPFFICIDHRDKRIYWSDYLAGSIETVLLDGTGHRVLLENARYHPFALTATPDHIVWTDNRDWGFFYLSSVYWAEKTSGNLSLYDSHLTFAHVRDVVYYDEYSQPQEYTNMCSDQSNGGCSQLCFPLTDTQISCTCSLGYNLATDGKTCNPVMQTSEYGRNTIFVGDTGRGAIFAVDTISEKISAIPMKRQTDITDAVIDVDLNMIFWSNVEDKTIMKSTLQGTDIQAIKSVAGHIIHSLTLDAKKKLLFYCDTAAGIVASMDYSGGSYRVVHRENATFSAVADSENSRLYLTVFSSVSRYLSRLMAMNYDGTDSKILVNFLDQPRGLAIDFSTNMMYWLTRNYVWSARIDGTNRNRIAPAETRYASLAVSGDYLYIADWKTNNQLNRVNRWNFASSTSASIRPFGGSSFLHTTAVFAYTETMTPSSTAMNTQTVQESSSTTAAPGDAEGNTGSSTSDSSTVIIAVVVSVIVVVIVIVVVVGAAYYFRRRKQAPPAGPPGVGQAFENPGYGDIPPPVSAGYNPQTQQVDLASPTAPAQLNVYEKLQYT